MDDVARLRLETGDGGSDVVFTALSDRLLCAAAVRARQWLI